ncbi:MAG: pyridoxal phosphate-dependent aminotransferase [Nitrospinota bacterium]
MKLAKRMFSFKPSATMAISGKVAQLNGEGKDIISFSVGEPDFDVPDFAKEAAIKAIRDGHNKYTPVPGNDTIKTGVLNYIKNELGLEYEKNQVIVSCGAKHSLYNISQVLFEEGDEVIIFLPYWVTYPDQVSLAGAKPVFVNCPFEKEFNPDLDELKAKISGKTRAIILNSPNNPSGAVFSGDAIRQIARIVVENDLILISDEVYDKLFYTDEKPLSPATIDEEVKKRTLMVNGHSKTFSMTGWRIGYTLGPPEIIGAMTKIQGQSTSNPVTPMQYAAAAALADLSFMEERVVEFKARRDIVAGAMKGLDGVECNVPKGAFYLFPDFSGWVGRSLNGEPIKDSIHLTNLLIDNARIAPVPGAAFGMENYLRFSYALDRTRLKEGLSRLSEFAASLK